MKNIGYLLLLTFLVSISGLQTLQAEITEPLLDSAKEAYTKGKFTQSAQYYERIVAKGYEGGELYFNLANAYFKSNNLPLAIVFYERAKKLSPWDEDIQFNLNLAHQKLIDKIDNTPDFIVKKWLKNAILLLSEKQWSWFMIACLWLAVGGFVLFLMAENPNQKRTGFLLGIIFTLLFIPVLIVSSLNHDLNFNHNEAVVTANSLTTKGSPTEQGTNLFVLHEGTKVKVLQTLGNWTEIKLPNGNTGWAKSSELIVI